MSKFRLQQEGYTSSTSISNVFIERYMPKAAGEFVKIYIYLLKCLEENQFELSISKIADALEDSEKDIVRALRYWERKGLLKLVFDGKTLCSLHLISANEIIGRDGDSAASYSDSSSIQVQVHTRASQTLSEQNGSATQSADQPDNRAHLQGTQNANVSRTKQYSKEDIDKFSGNEEISLLIYSIQKYLGRTLTGTDINTILFFNDTLGLPTDVIEYLFEYCVSSEHKNMRYIESVGIAWADEGIKTLKAAKAKKAIYSKLCYPVLNAFGLSGRQPTKGESDYVAKWSLSYGYPLEIILEACNRTMNQIHQPSFEYTDSILNRWKASKVSTMEDIKALDSKRSESLAQAEKIANSKKKTGSDVKAATGNSSNRFNNFDQRTYDYSSIEEKLFNT